MTYIKILQIAVTKLNLIYFVLISIFQLFLKEGGGRESQTQKNINELSNILAPI